jgi:hypothetical protein
MFPVSTTPEEFFLMRSKQLLFCFTAAACIAIAADASAETRHNTSKSTGAATATTHAGPNTIHAHQQGMSGMRANAGNRNFSAEERLTGARNGNPNFAAEERMSRRPGNRIFATEERMTGTRSYAGDRIYAGRDRFNGTRAFSENRTFISGDHVAERRGNRIYATTGYGGTAYGGFGRTWRGNRFLGGGAAEVVAAGVDLGLSYDSPSAYYEYPDNAYGYNYGVGFGTDALYAYAPRYGIRYRPAPLYDYAPGYSVDATAAPLYNFAPGYVSTVGYARGQSCRCSP